MSNRNMERTGKNISVKVADIRMEGTPDDIARLVQALQGKAEGGAGKAGTMNTNAPTKAAAVTENENNRKRRKIRTRRRMKKWSKEEEEFIKANKDNDRNTLAKRLGRTKTAVNQRLSHMRQEGRLDDNKNAVWSEWEENYLKANWHTGGNTVAIANKLNRTADAIYARAYILGLTGNRNKSNMNKNA